MHTITFRGAQIRYCDIRKEEESAPFIRLHVTAEMTKPVMDAMEWSYIPDRVESCKLEGSLTSRSLILTPNDKLLRDREIQIECSVVSSFKCVRITEGAFGCGESTKLELRFIARSNQADAAALVREYMAIVGKAEAALKVSYVGDDSQKELPLDEELPLDDSRTEVINGHPVTVTREQREAVAAVND